LWRRKAGLTVVWSRTEGRDILIKKGGEESAPWVREEEPTVPSGLPEKRVLSEGGYDEKRSKKNASNVKHLITSRRKGGRLTTTTEVRVYHPAGKITF